MGVGDEVWCAFEDKLRARANRMVREHSATIEAGARELIRRRKLSASQVAGVMKRMCLTAR